MIYPVPKHHALSTEIIAAVFSLLLVALGLGKNIQIYKMLPFHMRRNFWFFGFKLAFTLHFVKETNLFEQWHTVLNPACHCCTIKHQGRRKHTEVEGEPACLLNRRRH